MNYVPFIFNVISNVLFSKSLHSRLGLYNPEIKPSVLITLKRRVYNLLIRLYGVIINMKNITLWRSRYSYELINKATWAATGACAYALYRAVCTSDVSSTASWWRDCGTYRLLFGANFKNTLVTFYVFFLSLTKNKQFILYLLSII